MTSRINFSLTQLEYVIAVYRHGHFAKAAEACHVTQPTLSMQVQKLEEELGVVVFDRSKKPILLTEAGQALIKQIQNVLFEAKKIASIVDSAKGVSTQGMLNVGIIPTIAPYLLPSLLEKLQEKYSKISLNIQEMQTHRIVEALDTDDIDVGILAIPLGISKVIERGLFFEPFSVLCHRGHELTKLKRVKHSALKSDDVWLLQEGHCLRNQVLDVCSIKNEKSSKRPFHFESGSLETLKNLVETYGGYTLLPALATDHLGSKTVLLPFERPIPAREVGLVYRREHYKSELIEALAESIIECIPEDIRKIRPKDLEVIPVED